MIGADVGKGSGSERVCIFTWAKYRVMWDGGGRAATRMGYIRCMIERDSIVMKDSGVILSRVP